MDNFNLDIKLVKMTIKPLKSNTSSGVGVVPAELLKSGTEGSLFSNVQNALWDPECLHFLYNYVQNACVIMLLLYN